MKQKNIYIDLHNHTNYSDGIGVDPRLNVQMAVLNGIDILAITDHDHYIAYFKAKDEAEKKGIILLPGSEITTPQFHIIALNYDPHNKRFLDFLAYSRDLQYKKCELRVKRLQEHGLPMTMKKINDRFPESRIGKYNIFVALVEDPDCRDFVREECSDLKGMYQRFQYYMGSKGVVGEMLDVGVEPKEAFYEIHKAGGLASIAHGPKNLKNRQELLDLIYAGLDLGEIQPNQRGKKYKAISYVEIEEIFHEHNMPITYGSDWHGPTFSRPFLENTENILYQNLAEKLNEGYVKIPAKELEEVFV